MINRDQDTNLVSLHPTATRTATGQGTGADVKDYVGVGFVVLDSTAQAGTGTLDITIEDSADNSAWAAPASGAVGSFTQITNAAASQQKVTLKFNRLRRYIRAKYTIGGGSPSVTFSVNAIGRKQLAA